MQPEDRKLVIVLSTVVVVASVAMYLDDRTIKLNHSHAMDKIDQAQTMLKSMIDVSNDMEPRAIVEIIPESIDHIDEHCSARNVLLEALEQKEDSLITEIHETSKCLDDAKRLLS